MSFEKEYSEATEVSTLSLSLFPPAIVKLIYILGLHLSSADMRFFINLHNLGSRRSRQISESENK